MRTRREQLSASQLMRKNPTEAIVDKGNHLRDALKYVLLSLPSPSERPRGMRRDELIRQAFETGTYPTLGVQMAHLDAEEAKLSDPFRIPKNLAVRSENRVFQHPPLCTQNPDCE